MIIKRQTEVHKPDSGTKSTPPQGEQHSGNQILAPGNIFGVPIAFFICVYLKDVVERQPQCCMVS